MLSRYAISFSRSVANTIDAMTVVQSNVFRRRMGKRSFQEIKSATEPKKFQISLCDVLDDMETQLPKLVLTRGKWATRAGVINTLRNMKKATNRKPETVGAGGKLRGAPPGPSSKTVSNSVHCGTLENLECTDKKTNGTNTQNTLDGIVQQDEATNASAGSLRIAKSLSSADRSAVEVEASVEESVEEESIDDDRAVQSGETDYGDKIDESIDEDEPHDENVDEECRCMIYEATEEDDNEQSTPKTYAMNKKGNQALRGHFVIIQRTVSVFHNRWPPATRWFW